MLTISVVVPSYNRRELLLRNLAALEQQTRQPDEILVVDNASSDGTADAVRARFPAARLIVVPPPNRGACFAYNLGLTSAAGDVLLMIDDDALPAPDLVARVAARFASRSELGVLACKALDPATGAATALWMADDARSDADGLLACATFDGAGVALRRSVVAQGGLFSERFFLYYNEPELTARLLLTGVLVAYDPQCVVYHTTRALRGGYLMARNSLWFAWLYLPAPWALWMSLMLPLAAVLRGWRNGTLIGAVRGLVAALFGLPWVFKKRRVLPAAVMPRYLPHLRAYGAKLGSGGWRAGHAGVERNV